MFACSRIVGSSGGSAFAFCLKAGADMKSKGQKSNEMNQSFSVETILSSCVKLRLLEEQEQIRRVALKRE
jgi:hypothetical protein